MPEVTDLKNGATEPTEKTKKTMSLCVEKNLSSIFSVSFVGSVAPFLRSVASLASAGVDHFRGNAKT
jgi:hypothetical protein